MKLTRVYGDSSGETRLEEVEVQGGFGAPIPSIAIRIGLSRSAHLEFHPAPARGLVVALRGEFEIATTTGDRKRFRQGEWLVVDDVGTKGHTFEPFAEDMELLHCQLPAELDLFGTQHGVHTRR
jgi:hypothetical protein